MSVMQYHDAYLRKRKKQKKDKVQSLSREILASQAEMKRKGNYEHLILESSFCLEQEEKKPEIEKRREGQFSTKNVTAKRSKERDIKTQKRS